MHSLHLLALEDRLENDEWEILIIWLPELKYLKDFSLRAISQIWKSFVTQFAVYTGPLVRIRRFAVSSLLLLVQPLYETIDMYAADRASAFAGANEWVILWVLVVID